MDGPTLFANLNNSPRLPTPPKDSNSCDEDKGICDTALELLSSTSLPYQLDTPHDSPHTTLDAHSRSIDRGSKRVSFTSTVSQINPLNELENLGCTPPSEKHISCPRPTRSILKRKASHLSSDLPMSDPPAPSNDRDFPTMLEDMMRGLSSSELSSRYDAYFVMNGCLKTYSDVPPQQALAEKMPVLETYIQRDLLEHKSVENPMSSKLVIEALRFATTLLLWLDETRQTASQGFQAFILNTSSTIITAKETSKILLNQYLHLLSIQDFSPKVMTKERACRILSALQGIEDRFKSKSVTANKIAIHKKLLRQEQGRLAIIQKAHCWVEHLFGCLLSPLKEIRIRAIDLGLSAGFDVGGERQPSKVFRDMFNKTSTGEGSSRTIAQTFIDRLTTWVGSKELSGHVPLIWAIVVIFMRSKEKPFDMWKYAAPWLKVLQKCFNSSDYQIRRQANQAWTRLIYAVAPDAKTPERTVDLLLSPIESQMKRSADSSEGAMEARRLTYKAYCTLLYYSFRPGADFEALDRYWKRYVVPVLFSSKSRQMAEPVSACRTLMSLFNAKPSKPWDINRVRQQSMLLPEELPGLDVRWLRSRANMIVTNLESLMLKEEWWTSEKDDCLFMRVWNSYTEAIGQASTKEVKASAETMTAVAKLMSSLGLYLDKATTANDRQYAYRRLCLVLPAAVRNIGPLPFIEKRLTRSSERLFEVYDTPSNRSDKETGQRSSALLHFLDTLLSQKVDFGDASFEDVLESLLGLALSSATSPLSRIKIIREFASSLRQDYVAGSASGKILWNVLISDLKARISVDTTDKESVKAGSVFREVVKILEVGIEQSHNIDPQTWYSLLHGLDNEIRAEKGPTASTTYLIEPLAGSLVAKVSPYNSDTLVEFSCAIISRAIWPALPTEVEKQHRRPLGRNQLGKIPGIVPFNHLYSLVSKLLISTFAQQEVTIGTKIQMINTVASFIEQCPLSCLLVLLEPIQEGLRAWITDRAQILNVNDSQSQMLFKAVVDLWSMMLEKIRKFGNHDTILLNSSWWVLTMGFASLHRAIVNLSIAAWNSTFGLEKHLDYPKELRDVLLKLSSFVEIQLPGLSAEDAYAEDEIVSLQFADTPEDLEQLGDASKPSHTAKSPKPPASQPFLGDSEKEVEREASSSIRTPEPSPAMRRAQRATPRLRHDNSQIEFAAIDSSPSLLGAIDSQLLTDHQKEVMERQSREAAAIFPDVRSTPNPATLARKESTPRLQLSQRDIVEASGGSKEPVSPTLPPTNNMTAFLRSSPTPGQRSTGSRRRSSQLPTPMVSSDLNVEMTGFTQEGQDFPSSPPSAVSKSSQSLLFNEDQAAPEVNNEDVAGMEGIEQSHGDEEKGESHNCDEPIDDNEYRREIADNIDKEGDAGVEKEPEQTASEAFVDASHSRDTKGVLRKTPQDDLLPFITGNAPDKAEEADLSNPEGSPDLTSIKGLEVSAPSPDLQEFSSEIEETDPFSEAEDTEMPDQPDDAASIRQQLEKARATSQVQVVVDHLSNYEDLVSSQIIREMASASQEDNTDTDSLSQANFPPSPSLSASMPLKKRGRPKRKRDEPAISSLPSTQDNNSDNEEILDSITVTQPQSEPSEHFETAMQEEEENNMPPPRETRKKTKAASASRRNALAAAGNDDEDDTAMENTRPRKKSRHSSEEAGGVALPSAGTKAEAKGKGKAIPSSSSHSSRISPKSPDPKAMKHPQSAQSSRTRRTEAHQERIKTVQKKHPGVRIWVDPFAAPVQNDGRVEEAIKDAMGLGRTSEGQDRLPREAREHSGDVRAGIGPRNMGRDGAMGGERLVGELTALLERARGGTKGGYGGEIMDLGWEFVRLGRDSLVQERGGE